MLRRYAIFYFLVFTIPLFFALSAWQSSRYGDLKRETSRLEALQTEWVESNKRLIAEIARLSSAERIEYAAREVLGLEKKRPEEVLQIRVGGERNIDG